MVVRNSYRGENVGCKLRLDRQWDCTQYNPNNTKQETLHSSGGVTISTFTSPSLRRVFRRAFQNTTKYISLASTYVIFSLLLRSSDRMFVTCDSTNNWSRHFTIVLMQEQVSYFTTSHRAVVCCWSILMSNWMKSTFVKVAMKTVLVTSAGCFISCVVVRNTFVHLFAYI